MTGGRTAATSRRSALAAPEREQGFGGDLRVLSYGVPTGRSGSVSAMTPSRGRPYNGDRRHLDGSLHLRASPRGDHGVLRPADVHALELFAPTPVANVRGRVDEDVGSSATSSSARGDSRSPRTSSTARRPLQNTHWRDRRRRGPARARARAGLARAPPRRELFPRLPSLQSVRSASGDITFAA